MLDIHGRRCDHSELSRSVESKQCIYLSVLETKASLSEAMKSVPDNWLRCSTRGSWVSPVVIPIYSRDFKTLEEVQA